MFALTGLFAFGAMRQTTTIAWEEAEVVVPDPSVGLGIPPVPSIETHTIEAHNVILVADSIVVPAGATGAAGVFVTTSRK